MFVDFLSLLVSAQLIIYLGSALQRTHVRPRLQYPPIVTNILLISHKCLSKRALACLNAELDRPFLLWLSYPEPHSPFVAPREYANRYDPDTLALPASWGCDLSGKPAHLRELHALMECGKLREADLRRLTQI